MEMACDQSMIAGLHVNNKLRLHGTTESSKVQPLTLNDIAIDVSLSQHVSINAKTQRADSSVQVFFNHLHFLLTFEVPRGKMRGFFLLTSKRRGRGVTLKPQ